MLRMLLLSNSSNLRGQYLRHAESLIQEHFKDGRKIFFVPYGNVKNLEVHEAMVTKFFSPFGFEILSAHRSQTPISLLGEADGIFISGGNTFQLLKMLQQTGLLDAIAQKVRQGIPYLGSSAGTLVCCPTIKTTTDMPIVDGLNDLNAMGLVPFQISARHPHHLDEPVDWDPRIVVTREAMLSDYHALESTPVVGLREGCALQVHGSAINLFGPSSVRYYEKNKAPIELTADKFSKKVAMQPAAMTAPTFGSLLYHPPTNSQAGMQSRVEKLSRTAPELL